MALLAEPGRDRAHRSRLYAGTDRVLAEILGYDEREIGVLRDVGAIA